MPRVTRKEKRKNVLQKFDASLTQQVEDEQVRLRNYRKSRRRYLASRWNREHDGDSNVEDSSPDKTPGKKSPRAFTPPHLPGAQTTYFRSPLAALPAFESTPDVFQGSPLLTADRRQIAAVETPARSFACRALFNSDDITLTPTVFSASTLEDMAPSSSQKDTAENVVPSPSRSLGKPPSPPPPPPNDNNFVDFTDVEDDPNSGLLDADQPPDPPQDPPPPPGDYESSSSSEDEDTPVKVLAKRLAKVQVSHNISYAAMGDLWDNVVVKGIDLLIDVNRNTGIPSAKVLREVAERRLKGVKIEAGFEHKERLDENGDPLNVVERNLKSFPKKRFPTDDWQLLYEITEISVSINCLMFCS